MFTLDTNALIYYLKADLVVTEVIRFAFEAYTPMFVATVTELELFSLPTIIPEEVAEANRVLLTLSIIPLDSKIARIGAKLRREYRLKTPDSIVAATALFTHSTLLTRNIKDFKKIPDLAVKAV